MMKPALIPALPRPVIVRPAIRALDVGAVAHTREPTSKMKTEDKKTCLIE